MNTAATVSSLEPANKDFLLTKEAYGSIAEIVRRECGINLSDNKMGLVKSRLQKRLRLLGLQDFSRYVDLLRTDRSGNELIELVSAISTNVTKFNREPHHFEHFQKTAMPQIIERLKNGHEVRIWSAGCSNGSEPYTIACVALDQFPEISQTKFRVLATDIDKHTLETARSGFYEHDMVSTLSPDFLTKFFKTEGGGYRISQKVKNLVDFKSLNLMSDWPMKKSYDVIFCRNVLIYFTNETQELLFERFLKQMRLNAFLYIGHSERISGRAQKCFQSSGPTTFMKSCENSQP